MNRQRVAVGPDTALNGRESAEPLVASGLWKSYRRSSWALRDVSVSIPGGAIVALVGPNGAGKTTLMRTWAGFERPTKGTAQVFGADAWRSREEATMHLAYVAQQPALYRGLTVADHLAMALHFRPVFDMAGARRRLEELAIDPQRRAGQLSGGQQSQLSLVIALGIGAEVLLLDEPLASLDPLARRQFLRLLTASTRDHGTTTVLSSHIVMDIADVCDRLLVVVDGRVVLDDAIASALREHTVVEGRREEMVRDSEVVGSYEDLSGANTFLLKKAAPTSNSRAPTLDELVMGYLAAAER